MKVLLTGATGFFGYHVSQVLLEKGYDVVCVGSRNYDLLDLYQAEKMFQDTLPQVVVHLAAKVGGILSNKSYPADFWYTNMLITAHIWELSKKYAIEKLVYIMPGCAYPKTAESPIKEEYLWNGYPDEYPAPGALAKKMGLAASYAYKQQYGMNSCVIIPANMYGENDNFDEYSSHVVPALISKMHKAKKLGISKISLWGSGQAIRDFIYAKDVALCLPFFIENDVLFETTEPSLRSVCNISTGNGYSIKDLAEVVKNVVEYKGNIVWDVSKPEGPINKIFDNSRMKSVGLSSHTSLKEGIIRTYQWFVEKH